MKRFYSNKQDDTLLRAGPVSQKMRLKIMHEEPELAEKFAALQFTPRHRHWHIPVKPDQAQASGAQ